MRIAAALGLATAIFAGLGPVQSAGADQTYDGPRSLRFQANGMMVDAMEGAVDLASGTAEVVLPCSLQIKAGAACGGSQRRQVSLSDPDLAKLRALAVEIKTKGLFDAACIKSQTEQREMADARDLKELELKKAAWKQRHKGKKGHIPFFLPITYPPLDPFYVFLTVDGVGTVTSTPESGNYKSESRCMAPATTSLWRMVFVPSYAETWPAP